MKYQVCNRCVMDTSDPEIVFDENGVCNHCKKFDEKILPYWKTFTKEWLDKKIVSIKKECQNAAYDCVIGLSGGVDSSYLLHYAIKEYNLRVLAVHVDAGWNTKIAEDNIKKLVSKLGIELHTIKIDWEEMRDLSVAFLKSGVANCDVPQDMAFFAALYEYATKKGIKYVLTGSNFATESILPSAWGHDAMDSLQLKDIHKKFGKVPLVTFPITSFFERYIYYPYICKMKVLRPLNNIPYNKQIALGLLQEEYGWETYGNKHCESIWTKFFQEYFLPTKFGYDKRRPHFTSMILAGDMTREEALEKLKEPLYNKEDLKRDLQVILEKLQLTMEEWQEIMNIPNKTYKDYENNEKLYQFKKQHLDIFFE
ncbi:N-acetyl sugar amidotransferase [Helicobacter pullorum]|uniref:N-acetyl sugar amidotransferase n=1 Tax=Helicobacter pullorum TaxID=35818 RepID=UPI000816AD23|nr:N-acetyl sugar amidotransferase [Helicobacter pullorum]KAB0572920.1 N-acetyl sugar amidotransferase [Helicobacter pullorum NCTC 12824]OCR12665.1 ExsB family protein [Helicobacter pullorum]